MTHSWPMHRSDEERILALFRSDVTCDGRDEIEADLHAAMAAMAVLAAMAESEENDQ